MAKVDWHWAVTNVGPDKLLVWLEPWAEEFEVPVRSTIALSFNSADAPAPMDITPERIVVWLSGGQTARVFIDDVFQDSASASMPVPDVFEGSTKHLLTLMFENHPEARLGGGSTNPPPQRLSVWRRLKGYFRI
jgi:hypothetical protein